MYHRMRDRDAPISAMTLVAEVVGTKGLNFRQELNKSSIYVYSYCMPYHHMIRMRRLVVHICCRAVFHLVPFR